VRTLLLLDVWEQALDAWLPVENGRLVDELLRLARDAGAHLRLAVAGGRALLTGPVSGLLTERWLLRAADPTDLVMAGVPAAALPGVMPPGRVLRVAPGGVETAHVAMTDALPPPRARPAAGPLRLRALPERLTVAELLGRVVGRHGTGPEALATERVPLATGLVPLGLGGDDAAPDGPPVDGPGWLVCGPPGPERSAALAAAGHVLLAAGRPVVVMARPGGAPAALGARGAVVVDPWTGGPVPDLLARLDRAPDAVLLVDDPAWLTAEPVEEALLDRLTPAAAHRDARWPGGAGPHLVVTCAPAQAALAFRGVLPVLREHRTGLLLGAIAPGDGDALGVAVAARPAGPPGRAVLVTAGRARAVQLALPEDP
jgi:S-DNA-T family DNA segregation ATPase FtsK/SpoIIIE